MEGQLRNGALASTRGFSKLILNRVLMPGPKLIIPGMRNNRNIYVFICVCVCGHKEHGDTVCSSFYSIVAGYKYAFLFHFLASIVFN